jgi:hypothetical protein
LTAPDLFARPEPVRRGTRLKYQKRVDGEWIKPKGAFHFIRCCDCSLVHLFEFRRNGSRVKFRAWRQTRRTSSARKERANDR